MNTISKIPDSTIQVYFPHPVPQSYQSISLPDFLALCPSITKLYVVRLAAAIAFDSHELRPLGTTATYTVIPGGGGGGGGGWVYRTCITSIVEIDGSEISLYTA